MIFSFSTLFVILQGCVTVKQKKFLLLLDFFATSAATSPLHSWSIAYKKIDLRVCHTRKVKNSFLFVFDVVSCGAFVACRFCFCTFF